MRLDEIKGPYGDTSEQFNSSVFAILDTLQDKFNDTLVDVTINDVKQTAKELGIRLTPKLAQTVMSQTEVSEAQLTEIKVNYDQWNTPPAKNLNDKHFAILKLMADGKPRERADMIRSATRLDPNPRSEGGFAGWNKLDYDLYKMGLLDVVDVKGGKKIFKINAKGRKARDKFAPAAQVDIDDTVIETWFERDRGMVSLLNKETEETIVEWWDEDLQQAVEDGFLNPKDYHRSAFEYAKEMRLL